MQHNLPPLELPENQKLDFKRFEDGNEINQEIQQVFNLFVDCCWLDQFYGQTGPVTFGSNINLEFLIAAAVAANKAGPAEGRRLLDILCEVVPTLRPKHAAVGLKESLNYIE